MLRRLKFFANRDIFLFIIDALMLYSLPNIWIFDGFSCRGVFRSNSLLTIKDVCIYYIVLSYWLSIDIFIISENPQSTVFEKILCSPSQFIEPQLMKANIFFFNRIIQLPSTSGKNQMEPNVGKFRSRLKGTVLSFA